MTAEPLAETTRTDLRGGAPLVESSHDGHVVVVAPDGSIAAVLGDAERVTFARSAVKPWQTAVCLEVIREHRPDLAVDDDLVAVSWASHRAEPSHLEAVARLLALSGTRPDDLTCPPDVAESDPSLPARRIAHNCSGKHALFALAGRMLGLSGVALVDPGRELQSRVLERLDRELGLAAAVAVDGCGAPAVAVPLTALARGFARLADGDADGAGAVAAAGLRHPGLVGGTGRLESALLAAGVVAKVGAEGVYAAGLATPAGSWGVAVKAEDGAQRAAACALATITTRWLGAELDWAVPEVRGGGDVVGEVRSSTAVERLAEVTAARVRGR